MRKPAALHKMQQAFAISCGSYISYLCDILHIRQLTEVTQPSYGQTVKRSSLHIPEGFLLAFKEMKEVVTLWSSINLQHCRKSCWWDVLTISVAQTAHMWQGLLFAPVAHCSRTDNNITLLQHLYCSTCIWLLMYLHVLQHVTSSQPHVSTASAHHGCPFT